MTKLAAQKNIGSAIIEQLRRDPAIAAALPILQNPPQLERRRRCGGCGRSPVAVSRQTDYEAVKRSIANATTEQKALIRQRLGTKLVRVTYLENGRTKTTIF